MYFKIYPILKMDVMSLHLLNKASCSKSVFFFPVIGKYAGTVKRYNVCKRHVSIDTGFERVIFLNVISMG